MNNEDRILQILEQVSGRLDNIDTRLETIDTHLETIDTHLETIDTHLETIDARLDTMDSRFDGIDSRLDAMDSRMDTMQDSINTLKKDMAHHNHYVEPLLKAVMDGIDGMQARNQQLDKLSQVVANHDDRIFALEQTVTNG